MAPALCFYAPLWVLMAPRPLCPTLAQPLLRLCFLLLLQPLPQVSHLLGGALAEDLPPKHSILGEGDRPEVGHEQVLCVNVMERGWERMSGGRRVTGS